MQNSPQPLAAGVERPGVWSAAREQPHAPAGVNPVVRAALYLFVFSIPFEMPQGRAIPIEVPTLTGFILLFATALNPSACFRRIPTALGCFGVYLWTAAAGIVLQRVEHVSLALELFVALAQLFLLLWVIHNVVQEDQRAMAGALLALVAACTVRAGIQVLGIGTTVRDVYSGARVTVLGQNANLSAIILSAGLAATVGLRAAPRPFLPLGLLTWPIAALIGVALIQTGSRGGLLCAIVGLAMFAFRSQLPWQRIRNGVVMGGALAILAWGAFQSTIMRARFQEASHGQLAGRERIYPTALDMFAEQPFLGWGLIANQIELARRIDDPRGQQDMHNLVLELLTSTGVVGAIPFLIGLIGCISHAWGARAGPLGAMPLAILAATLVGTISGTWIASKILWLALAFALASRGYARASAAPAEARS
jgi:O-antigen ligase